MAELIFPFGKADSQSVTPAAGVAAATIANNLTIVDLGTLAANTTLNLTLDKDLNAGAVLIVKAASDGTARSLTFGTGCTAAAVSGTINKTKTKMLMFNGTTFLGLNEQID